MKKLNHLKEVYGDAYTVGGNIYVTDGEIYVRDITLDLGIGKEISVGVLSDIHINYCNKQDFDEADPVLMSTYENRVWQKDAATLPKLRACLDLLDDMDAIVINGDTMDYLSHGAMELMQKEIWDRVPGAIVTSGGHEFCIKMQGKIPEVMSYEERFAIVKKYWKQDIEYETRLVGEKVLLIGMLNDLAKFNQYQKERLSADIKMARECGYSIIIFAHEPILTKNPAYAKIEKEDVLCIGDPSGFPRNLYDLKAKIVGSEVCDALTNEVYDLIVENADVVKAVVTAHYHSDFYLEIKAKTSDGEDTVIPQFITTATAYGKGHATRILIK